MKVDGTNLSMIRGDTEAITISCTNQKGEPIPFVDGDVVYLTVKLNSGTEKWIFQKEVRNFTDGTAIIDILPEDTRDEQFKVYKYDIQLISSGKVTTLVAPSLFTIEPEITFNSTGG